jgi:hypothetical protein
MQALAWLLGFAFVVGLLMRRKPGRTVHVDLE